VGLGRALGTGECTAVEVASMLLDRLEQLTPVIGAVAATDPDRTLQEAKAADERLRLGAARPLEGVPFTVKDWIDAEGWPVTGATGTLPGNPDRRPTGDAAGGARGERV
jgi:Asp-tRNA(Asn)/Glu-tRNA(Gln) amidotransferase A subunit family amidase